MYDRFIQERIADPMQPEIRLFDESILEKRNRSKMTIMKNTTPFLLDKRYCFALMNADDEK